VSDLGEEKNRPIVVLRLRGSVNIRGEVEDTLRLMRLQRRNHATIIDNRHSNVGMLQKVKDYVTWGDATLETIDLMLRNRGRTPGNRRLTNEYVNGRLGYKSIKELAEAVNRSEANLSKMPGLKPVFRLHPPKGGLRKTVKKAYPEGELGYRGEAVNDLVKKML